MNRLIAVGGATLGSVMVFRYLPPELRHRLSAWRVSKRNMILRLEGRHYCWIDAGRRAAAPAEPAVRPFQI